MASAQDQVQDAVHYPEDELLDGDQLGAEAFDQPASFTTSKSLKDEDEKTNDEAEKARSRDVVKTLKSSLIVSGAVVAVIGAVLAIAKKIKEA